MHAKRLFCHISGSQEREFVIDEEDFFMHQAGGFDAMVMDGGVEFRCAPFVMGLDGDIEAFSCAAI